MSTIERYGRWISIEKNNNTYKLTVVHSLLDALALPYCFAFDFAQFDFLPYVFEALGDELVEFLLSVHLHLLRDHW